MGAAGLAAVTNVVFELHTRASIGYKEEQKYVTDCDIN